jgi:hypothetical protein
VQRDQINKGATLQRLFSKNAMIPSANTQGGPDMTCL